MLRWKLSTYLLGTLSFFIRWPLFYYLLIASLPVTLFLCGYSVSLFFSLLSLLLFCLSNLVPLTPNHFGCSLFKTEIWSNFLFLHYHLLIFDSSFLPLRTAQKSHLFYQNIFLQTKVNFNHLLKILKVWVKQSIVGEVVFK